ncbi:MAG: hypothetical protein NTY00_13150 [Deltaproteobacteria bacterium]|nr:hypothetical protein [Deltaproteobacteria bacterium]
MKHFFPILIASLFIGFIFTLPFVTLVKQDALVSEFEKRQLAKLPEVKFNLQSLVKFPRQFEIYFNDHIGGRDQLISLYNTFNFRVLKKSPISSATVGEKDWLFFNADGELLDFMGLMQKDFTTLEGYRNVLESRRDWLAKLGIRYLFLPVPNKMMIYEEYLPLRVRQEKGVTVYDQLMDHMQKHSDFTDFIDLKAILLKAKEERQMYFRTDSHWNLDGSLVADRAIIQHLQQWFPQLQTLELSDLKRSEIYYRGDLAILMHVQGAIGEKVSVLEVKDSCRNKIDQKLFGFVNKNKKLANDARFLPEINGCKGKPLKALVIHDSFGNFLRPYLSEQFGKVIYMNYSNFTGMKEWIVQERPDVVIDQRVARNLPLSLAQDQEMEKDLLQEEFKWNEGTCLHLDADSAQSAILDSHDLSVIKNSDGLLINASGADPYLVYSCGKCLRNGETVVHISLTSPQDTEMQFYYTTEERREFSSVFSRILHIQKGDNELFFRVPRPGIVGKIRLDPGTVPGQYILHELIIKKTEVKSPVQ